MTELFIENKKLDITSELAYLLTFSVDDVKDFGSRNCTFSKTIVLPGTANNNYLFGHIFDVTVSNPYSSTSDNVATNFNPSVSADCIAFNDRLQVFKGTIRLLEIIIDNGQVEYEVALFGELGGLVSSIGAKKLEELDFSAYNHDWTAANVTGSWENVTGGGYYYGLIDYGTVSTGKVDYDIKAFRPAFYVREYIKKIIEGAGYSWSSNLMDTSRFKSLIVPNNQARFQFKTDLIFYVYRTSNYTAYDTGGSPSTLPQYVKFNLLDTLGSFTANVDNNEFTYTGADTLITGFNVEMQLVWQGHLKTLHTKILKNGSSIYDFPDVGSSATPISFTHQVSDLPVQINTGDVFKIEFTVTNLGGLSRTYIDVMDAIWSINTAADVWTDINYGDPLVLNDGIPRNVLQRDFLSSVTKLFNAYIYENKLDSKKLYIEPYTDFYDLNVSGVVDWTYKIDRSRPVRLKPMSELNSRYYDFKFKEDSDYYNDLYKKTYNESYGDYIYDSEYEFTNDKTEVSLIFSPTPLVGYAGVDKIVSAIYKLNSGVEEKFASNIRILQAKKITGVASWSIKNGGTTLHTGTDYGYCGHYDDPDAPANDIQFGVPRELYFTLVSGAVNVTQFNVYWSPYMAEITDKDSKLMTCYMKLDSTDIFNLDFSKLVYVDGSYWRLNKIVDWNVNEPDVCQVELLKVINLVY